MYKFRKYQAPKIFNIDFEMPTHKYSSQFQKLTLNTKNIIWIVQNIKFLWEDQRFGMNSNQGRKRNTIPFHIPKKN